MDRVRLDVRLVEEGLVESRTLAQRLVMAGQVRVNGQMVLKPSTITKPEDNLEIDRGSQFVSRGGDKLNAALEAFNLSIAGNVCADIGASTGGFTDCLLKNGAKRVYAIDVGRGILDWSLRNDPRVIVFEGTNIRYLQSLPEMIDLITIDVSFISLKIVLPAAIKFLNPGKEAHATPIQPANSGIIALIKPQFEAGRTEVKRGKGVIKDPTIHHRVVSEIITCAEELKLNVSGIIRSPLTGPKGNQEFLIYLTINDVSRSEEINALEMLFPPDDA